MIGEGSLEKVLSLLVVEDSQSGEEQVELFDRVHLQHR